MHAHSQTHTHIHTPAHILTHTVTSGQGDWQHYLTIMTALSDNHDSSIGQSGQQYLTIRTAIFDNQDSNVWQPEQQYLTIMTTISDNQDNSVWQSWQQYLTIRTAISDNQDSSIWPLWTLHVNQHQQSSAFPNNCSIWQSWTLQSKLAKSTNQQSQTTGKSTNWQSHQPAVKQCHTGFPWQQQRSTTLQIGKVNNQWSQQCPKGPWLYLTTAAFYNPANWQSQQPVKPTMPKRPLAFPDNSSVLQPCKLAKSTTSEVNNAQKALGFTWQHLLVS